MAEVCVDIDTTTWTRQQIDQLLPVAYNLLVEAGDDLRPRVDAIAGGHRICVDDPTIDVPTVLTAETILARYAEWFATWEEARVRAEADVAEATTELAANSVGLATLSTIDATIDGLNSLDDVKAYLKTLTRYILANRVLGGRLS